MIHYPGLSMPYRAQVWGGGKQVHLGCFATAEEAALCVARSPEEQAAAGRGTGKAPARRTRTAKLMHAPPFAYHLYRNTHAASASPFPPRSALAL